MKPITVDGWIAVDDRGRAVKTQCIACKGLPGGFPIVHLDRAKVPAKYQAAKVRVTVEFTEKETE